MKTSEDVLGMYVEEGVPCYFYTFAAKGDRKESRQI